MMSKKILAVLLSLSMISSAVGMPVFADEIEAETAEVLEMVEAEETEGASVPYTDDEIVLEETGSIETEESNEKTEFDNIWNVALMATEETSIEQPIEKDQTYSFENIDILAHDITGLSNYIDYVIYYKDGSIKTYLANQKPNTLSIPAGGKITITSISGTVKAVVADEYFLIDEKQEPVFHKVKLNLYETYTYTNTSSVAYKVLYRYSNSGDYGYDYVLYDADDNVSKYAHNICESIEVPAGYSLKVTQTGPYGQELNALYDKFTLVKNDEPVMRKVKLSAGESYTYTNTSNVAYKVLYRYSNSGDYGYDYVLYDADGNVSKYAHNTCESIEIPAGYSLKVTQTGPYGQELNALYDKFTLVKNDEPVMRKVKLSAGESYTYTNTSNVAYKVLYRYSNSGDYGYDYVLYYSNGKVKETQSKTCGNIEVPAGGSLKITQVGIYGQELNGLYEAFDITNNGSLMATYKIINADTVDATLKLKSGYSYDYSIYDANNVLTNYGVNSTSAITIPKGGYVIATVNTTSNNPFEDNSVLSISEYASPAYKITHLNPDETYKYTNNGSRELKVYKNGLACDYVIHNADGSINSYQVNSTENSFTVPIGGNICITSHNYIHLKGLYDYFSVEKIDNNVFDVSFVGLGETYQFINNAVKDINLYTNSNVYDYVIYNADGSVSSEAINSTSTTLKIPSGCKCAITPQTSNISIYALKEAFTGISKRNYPVMKRTSIYFGSPAVMNNVSDENRKIYASPNNYIDWASYDIGNNAQTAKELVSPSTIEVPANGKVEITARASNVTFGGLYEFFSNEDLSTKVTGVELSQSTLTLAPNKQTILRATVLPSDATNKTVTWSSSNTSVAVVAQTGKVTAKAVGTATITATTADGGYTASCVVTVLDGTTPISTPTPTQKPDEPTPPVTDGAVVKVSSVTASAGNTVNVTVDLSGNTGFANLGIQVGYDANNLTLTSVTNNASVGATYTGAQSITANPYNMGWDSTSNVTYNGNLATLTFRAKENATEGKYPITVSYYKGISGNYTDGEDVNYDADFNSLDLNYVNGVITVSSHIAGDINGDGKVNNQDGTFLLRHLAGWNVNIDESALDVNGDGRVNNQDGTVLLRYLAGWSVTIH